MSPEPVVVFAAVSLPFVAALLMPLAFRLLGERTGYLAAGVSFLCFALLATQHGAEGVVSLAWIPSLGISLRFAVDGWAVLFALVASGMGVLVSIYSPAYLHGESGLARYYAALVAFLGSILGVALAADLIALFVFWELTSLCSFVLIGFHTEDDSSRYAARMSMLVTVGGGLFMLAGFLLLAQAAGDPASFDLAAMLAEPGPVRDSLREAGLFVPALALIAVGATTKSAQVPVHFWLPSAMAAPTPVSAFLHSATMVKVGVYLLGRLRPLLESPEWSLLFSALGLATMLVCAMLAVASTDVKELLAYSTASHLGLMVAGFGFASGYGAEAGVFHLLNHALFKAALFLIAGIVAHEAGTRELAELGGLRHELPFTAAITAVVALSMAGIPPFSGFYSKELLFNATVEAAGQIPGAIGWLYPAVAVLASVFTVLYSVRFLALFFGSRPDGLGHVTRPAPILLVSPAILGALTAVISVSPGIAIETVVRPAVDATVTEPREMPHVIPTSYSTAVGMSALAIGLGLAAYPFYGRFHRGIGGLSAAIPPVAATWWYDAAIDGLERAGRGLAARVQNGLLRTYATWTLGATCAIALAGFAAAGALSGTMVELEASIPIALVAAVAVVAAIAVVRSPSHVVGVLTLSIVGFMLAIVYILASAPDLALTQLVVETLVLLVFLLVIEEIPESAELPVPKFSEMALGRVGRDAVLSLAVGATAFVTVLVTTDARPEGASEIARYYAEQAVPEGGGTNIVNVVLVDFRAFDTMGELVVVAVAAISVLTLLVMRGRGEDA
ncbi:hydrogen gas-evolving membrane-bound hydrogenase subunit E [Saliphagus infecundisoli]|uniref:Hydrogen gas-evolving membrane-bound hydrogenase subunit E n=1 Tax=Saliphagus infecundisoli TaxID=1849069 RepID=A0ABD5QMD1_9EURY|nr:hydrogen gas-evolving membrane-bound hydrogenase subunit E [Saliphagus infecundisoli]